MLMVFGANYMVKYSLKCTRSVIKMTEQMITNITRCDNCGCEFNNAQQMNLALGKHDLDSYMEIYLFGVDDRERGEDRFTQIDLCHECTNAVQAALNEQLKDEVCCLLDKETNTCAHDNFDCDARCALHMYRTAKHSCKRSEK
jgi:hypothetical protein